MNFNKKAFLDNFTRNFEIEGNTDLEVDVIKERSIGYYETVNTELLAKPKSLLILMTRTAVFLRGMEDRSSLKAALLR